DCRLLESRGGTEPQSTQGSLRMRVPQRGLRSACQARAQLEHKCAFCPAECVVALATLVAEMPSQANRAAARGVADCLPCAKRSPLPLFQNRPAPGRFPLSGILLAHP